MGDSSRANLAQVLYSAHAMQLEIISENFVIFCLINIIDNIGVEHAR